MLLGALTASLHAVTVPDNCLVRNDWVCPLYVSTREQELLSALGQHVYLTVASLVLGLVVGVPLAVLAHRVARLRGITLGVTTVIYTIPSIALFFLLLPELGLSDATVIVALGLYNLVIVSRGVLAGLDGVDPEVRDAATGMGLGRWRVLWRVEAPLALPAAMAGLRVAAVSTVALATVGTVVGHGGLGNLLSEGYQSDFKAQMLTASVLCVLLAAVLDLLLLALQRLVTPWRRA